MHQPFEDEQDYLKARKEHLDKLTDLWDAVLENRVSDDEVKQRLEALKWEEQKIKQLKPTPRKFSFTVVPGGHAMSLKCQCPRCVKLHTINMEDRKFLKSLGIVWRRDRG